jgi:hypothetical protein
MDSTCEHHHLIHSYLTLRKAVGLIGLSLPFTLMTGFFILFHGDRVLFSISHYYYSGMRDVFVGTICFLALLLFFYRGYDNWGRINWDKWITNLSGFFALGIAFFPATIDGSVDWQGSVHFICAASFFLLVALYMIIVFTKKSPHPTKEKLFRNKIYVTCGLVMIGCIMVMLIYFSFILTQNTDSSFVFWCETFALTAFGIAWLTKGGALFPDKTTATSEENKKSIRIPDKTAKNVNEERISKGDTLK